jgi:glyoxylase-like metal-dependent hydrolase (beta-lactamase superfamily II)
VNAQINQVSNDLCLITLIPPINGFTDFIGTWLYQGETTFIVDVGPSVTAPALLDALQKLNIGQLDYIFLTHIHLDHAGGIGEIAASYPQTPIICHKASMPHLIDPARLWKSTKKILGKMALAYGPIKSIPRHRLFDARHFRAGGIVPIITPGHAPHHVSYRTKNYLFAGETGGVYLALYQKKFYMRPATPPLFFLDVALNSIDALMAGPPAQICYGHFGINDDALTMLEVHRKQLLFWENAIKAEIQNSETTDIITACMKRLLAEDPLLAQFNQLPSAVQERERFFLQNSINGYLGYLKAGA